MSYSRIDSDYRVSSPSPIQEVQNFDKFTTVDWIEEERLAFKQTSTEEELESSESPWTRYLKFIWIRGRTFITLTIIGLLIGGIAGFLQIFTEALVNWKSGHCERNWLLNKSFCCAGINEEVSQIGTYFSKRDEFQCIKQGVWVERSNPILSFTSFIVLSLLFATVSCLMVLKLAPFATGSGISEIKSWVSGFQYTTEFLNLKTLIVKSISLPLAISSGLSVGKEGPSVHYATCCGYVITNWLLGTQMFFPEQSEYLTASAAGGVAVAFGAPIGGVLFALEEMSSSIHFKLSTLWKSYYIALAGISALQYINPSRNGKVVVFEVTYDRDWHVEEIAVFILFGIFGGLYGNYISKWNIHYVSFRKKYLSKWPLQEVIVLTFITAFLSYFNEFLKLDMTESMEVLFHECVENEQGSMWSHRLCQIDKNSSLFSFISLFLSLIFATCLRALLIVASYGCKVPAGIFVPSMAVGATFGRAISLIVERFITGPNVITPGTYAFLGATAALSGITNLTITVVVIMFELTGAFTYILPTMVVAAITRIMFSYLGTEGGIADQMIIFNGFPLMEERKGDNKFIDIYYASDIMTEAIITVDEITTRYNIQNLIHTTPETIHDFPIVKKVNDSNSVCVGLVSKETLKMYLDSTVGESEELINLLNPDDSLLFTKVNQSPISVKPTTSLAILFMMFQKMGCSKILVEKDGSLVGLLTKKDVLKYTRVKHNEFIGPLYEFDEFLERKAIVLIEKCIDRFKRR